MMEKYKLDWHHESMPVGTTPAVVDIYPGLTVPKKPVFEIDKPEAFGFRASFPSRPELDGDFWVRLVGEHYNSILIDFSRPPGATLFKGICAELISKHRTELDWLRANIAYNRRRLGGKPFVKLAGEFHV
jgi:hypothetical protein